MYCQDCGLKKAEQAIKGQTKFCKTCGDIVFSESQVIPRKSYNRPSNSENDIIGDVVNHDYTKEFEEISEKTQTFLKPIFENAKRLVLIFIEWIKRNLLLVGIGVFALIIGFGAYKFFFAPNPEKEGKEIAMMDCDCINNHKIAISETYQKFMSDFDSFKFTKRQDANDKLRLLENPLVEKYEKCKDEIESKAYKYVQKFKGNGYVSFITTYQSSSCTKRVYGSGMDSTVAYYENYVNPILASNQLRSKILEKIEKINDPIPTISKIREDLLGKDFTRFRVSYPSEMGNIQIVKSEYDATGLRIETRVQFEDNQTKEKYNSIINLFYSNASGQWYFNRAEEKLFVKPEQNYYVGKELCVVGKWRWERNYATYYADGTWEGKWDDGTETVGTWRIVFDNFILTKNGNVWVTGVIEDFNNKEIKVNFGSGSSTGQKIGQAPSKQYSSLFYQ